MNDNVSISRQRRRLLQIIGGTALPALPAMRAAAAVVGNPAVTSWAMTSDPTTYAQAFAARFTNTFVNVLSAVPVAGVTSFYAPDAGTTNKFTILAQQSQQNVLGVPGKLTTIWGYKNYQTAQPTFPGRSFQVQRGTPVTVSWQNNLRTAAGPLPHLLPVDQTITIQAPTTGVPLAVHHHGGDTAFEFDGGPDQWSTPVRQQIGPGITAAALDPAAPAIRYQYTNAQEASMHWYHDHAEGLTRINVHAGLAGLYVVRDANETLLRQTFIIPTAPYELALVLQDRCFDAVGNLAYSANPADYPDPAVAATLPANAPTHMPEMFGDVILVNGKAWPNLTVEPRPYRVRLLNGSDSRFYTLNFGTAPIYQVGTDLGFLNRGVRLLTDLTIAPGERVDLVVDFTNLAASNIVVTNSAATPFPFGDPPTGGATVVMRFQALLPRNNAVPLTVPALLPSVPLRITTAMPLLTRSDLLPAQFPTAKVRRVLLGEGVDQYGRILPLLGTYDPVNAAANLGTLGFGDPATEKPILGATEIWEIWNVSEDAHPVHLHLVQFRIIDRRPFTANPLPATTMSNGWTGVKLDGPITWGGPAVVAPANEQGYKDTVVCPPGQMTRIMMNFNRRGKYVYHCHILSHEEHDMMRWYQVL
jgi:spore coat protein A, manganese oxidase